MNVRNILRVMHFAASVVLALPALAQEKTALPVSLSPFQVRTAAKAHHLQPIVGKALRQLIVGSIVAEMAENGRTGPGEIYGRDGIYRFSSDIVPTILIPYRIEQDQVCVLSEPNRLCFAYFRKHKGGYRRQRYDGTFSAVSIRTVQ